MGKLIGLWADPWWLVLVAAAAIVLLACGWTRWRRTALEAKLRALSTALVGAELRADEQTLLMLGRPVSLVASSDWLALVDFPGARVLRTFARRDVDGIKIYEKRSAKVALRLLLNTGAESRRVDVLDANDLIRLMNLLGDGFARVVLLEE